MNGSFMSSLEKYVKRDRDKIKGWLTWIDAEIMRTLLSSNDKSLILRNALEIGVHRGKSAILFLLSPNIEKLIAVDLFENQLGNVDNSGSEKMKEFLRNIEKFQIDMSRLDIIETDSTTLKVEEIQIRCKLIDIIHIDGGHVKAVVLSDLNLAKRILSNHGVIIVDDFLRPDWPEVGQAVYEWLNSEKSFQIFCIGFNKVFISRKSYIARWQKEVCNNGDLKFFKRKTSSINGVNIPNYYHYVTTEWGFVKRFYEYVRLFHPGLFIRFKQFRSKIPRN